MYEETLVITESCEMRWVVRIPLFSLDVIKLVSKIWLLKCDNQILQKRKDWKLDYTKAYFLTSLYTALVRIV